MKPDEWNRSPNQVFLYMEWNSIRKKNREHWVGTRHSNSSYEMHLILEGEAEVEINEEKHRIQAGQGLMIPPGVFHSGTNVKGPFLRLTASFLPRSENFFHLEETAFFTFSRRLRRLSYDILEEYDNDSTPWKREMLSAMFFRLMISVFRQLRPETGEEASFGENDPLVVTDFFFSGPNLKNKPTRKDLADLLHCSERQVNRLLPEMFGMTFQKKMLQARIDYAKFLLRTTDLCMEEVAVNVGYENASALHCAFRKEVGMTPCDFRKLHQNK